MGTPSKCAALLRHFRSSGLVALLSGSARHRTTWAMLIRSADYAPCTDQEGSVSSGRGRLLALQRSSNAGVSARQLVIGRPLGSGSRTWMQTWSAPASRWARTRSVITSGPPPGDHRIHHRSLPPSACSFGPEPNSVPCSRVVGQGQVQGHELAADPACLGRVCLQQHRLLDRQQRPRAEHRTRGSGRLGRSVYSSAPADRSAASSSMRGPRAASTSGGFSASGGPCQGAASMASR